MADELDIIDVLERDHRRIDGWATKLDYSTDADEVRQLYVRIVDALTAHEQVETDLLFPAFAQLVGTSRDERMDVLEQRVGEHTELNEMLAEMRALDPHDYAFIKRGSALLLEVEGHFAREEATVFARMRADVPSERLLQLGGEARRLLAPAVD